MHECFGHVQYGFFFLNGPQSPSKTIPADFKKIIGGKKKR